MSSFLNSNSRIRWFEISILIFFWLLLFASPLLLWQSESGIDWNHVFKVWKERAVLFVLFMANRFILVPYLFLRSRQALYTLSVAVLISIAAIGTYLNSREPGLKNSQRFRETPVPGNSLSDTPQLPPPQRQDRSGPNDPSRPEPIPAYVNLLILSFLVFGFDTGLKVSSKWLESEQQRISLEKEHIETQLAFLKHQISPHFFMNTLNNIHSLIDIDTAEAKKSVIKLSNLMRHLLYESDHEISPLKSEVDFIRSYVDLMKLRYSSEVRIDLKIPDHLPDKSIPPLLFVSLLDNAFKHGISYIRTSFVEIVLSLKPDKLFFNITNSKTREMSEEISSGIGIENTRKRLDLLYGGNYTLETADRGNIFITTLIIPL